MSTTKDVAQSAKFPPPTNFPRHATPYLGAKMICAWACVVPFWLVVAVRLLNCLKHLINGYDCLSA
jgi:hypothetical protein